MTGILLFVQTTAALGAATALWLFSQALNAKTPIRARVRVAVRSTRRR